MGSKFPIMPDLACPLTSPVILDIHKSRCALALLIPCAYLGKESGFLKEDKLLSK